MYLHIRFMNGSNPYIFYGEHFDATREDVEKELNKWKKNYYIYVENEDEKGLYVVASETLTDYINSLEMNGVQAEQLEDGKTEIAFTNVNQDFRFEINNVHDIYNYYVNFDVDEEVEMWLEAKRNGLQGVPSARELVFEESIIEETLRLLVKKTDANLLF